MCPRSSDASPSRSPFRVAMHRWKLCSTFHCNPSDSKHGEVLLRFLPESHGKSGVDLHACKSPAHCESPFWNKTVSTHSQKGPVMESPGLSSTKEFGHAKLQTQSTFKKSQVRNEDHAHGLNCNITQWPRYEDIGVTKVFTNTTAFTKMSG